jgi:hypothetical protein
MTTWNFLTYPQLAKEVEDKHARSSKDEGG